MKKILIYDGTVDGFLTAVYTVFDEQLKDAEIVKPKHFQPNIFIDSQEIITDTKKAKRVWHSVQLKVTKSGVSKLYASFFSEIKGIENVLLRYILFAYSTESFIHTDYSNKDVTRVLQVSKMVYRERDRVEAVLRFQLTKDGIYFAAIEPDFNVLPLLLKYTKNKYPTREWIIFDKKRRVGVHYKDGIIYWINAEEFFSKTSRRIKRNYSKSLFLDSNHLKITRNQELKSVI